VKSAEAALGAAAPAGMVLGVAYPRRFHPAMIELRARVQDGRLGILTHCESARRPVDGVRPIGAVTRRRRRLAL
jgi:predicted dehydrogenase